MLRLSLEIYLRTRLSGITTECRACTQEPRTDGDCNCVWLNFNILKLVYYSNLVVSVIVPLVLVALF